MNTGIGIIILRESSNKAFMTISFFKNENSEPRTINPQLLLKICTTLHVVF